MAEANVAIPPLLDCLAAGDLKPKLVAALERGEDVRLDGAEVQRATAQGLQLVVAAAESFRARGLAFAIGTPSPALSEAAALLGLKLEAGDL